MYMSRRPGARAAKLAASEKSSSCTITVWMEQNRAGMILKEEYATNYVELMRVKQDIEGVMMKAVYGYVPQVGCEIVEKEKFRSE